MATSVYIFEVSRGFMLKLWPRIWRDTLRDLGVSLWHPSALWLFVVGAWAIVRPSRSS